MIERIVLFLQRVVYVGLSLVMRIRTIGLDNIPRTGPAIIASNHSAGVDPFVIGCKMPRVCYYLAKKELFDNYFLGSLLKFLRAIPVDRFGQSISGVREIKRALDAGKLILLFPEGTRSRDGSIKKPKEGVGMLACTAKAVVIPTYIEGLLHQKPSFFKRPVVTVSFGKPIDPAELTQQAESRKDGYGAVSQAVYEQLVQFSERQSAA
ncbi:1-acyl-sn-glycerol-3-phosphate acyltransferase [candidate division KSB1 bacterium]|nr:1-acyl-sn-glycerol-3-phosphate acyltransferase [candidate division KSB1 bacterium]